MYFATPMNIRFSTPYIGIPILRIRVETVTNPFAQTSLIHFFLKCHKLAEQNSGKVMEIEPSKEYSEINDNFSVAFFSFIFKTDGDMKKFIGNF